MVLRDLTEAEVEASGEALGAVLRSGHVVLLEGPMGAGKTTFTRAVARGMGVARPERVRSPTFNLCLIHDGPVPLLHVDLFRLDHAHAEQAMTPAAFEALGLEAWLDRIRPDVLHGDEAGVLVVEWADLWDHALGEHLRIRLERPARPDRRHLRASAEGERHRALARAWERLGSGSGSRERR